MSASDFGETLMELVDTSYPEPADHPSHDRWLAYLRGEVPTEEEERLAEHLVRCRDCCDLVQAAEDLFGPDEEATPGSDRASAALWHQLQPQLSPGQESRSLRAPRSRGRFHFPSALAASLLLALVGMTGWNLQQRRELAELRTPKPNAPIVDFSADERVATTGEVTLAAGSGPWVFVFHPGGEQPTYRLAIREAASGREISSFTLRLDTDFALTFQLPEGLPVGRYRLEIVDRGKVLQTRLLKVTAVQRGG